MVEGTKDARLRRWVRWLTLGGSVSFVVLAGPSCAYDKNNPCGDDLVVDFDANGNRRCVCPVGTFYSPTGCITCGEHEFLQGDACVCEEGFAKPTADAECEEVVDTSTISSTGTGTTTSGSGGGNTSGNTGGNGANNTTGAGGAAGAGGEGGDSGEDTDSSSTESSTTSSSTTASSTTGSVAECTVNEDCATEQICDAGACRAATGWGQTCETSDDCAGLEANFCDSFQFKCTVSNCSNVPDTCPSGFQCCDLSAIPGFAVMCIPDNPDPPAQPYCTTPAP